MQALVFASKPANDNGPVPEFIDPEATPPYPFFRLDIPEDEAGEGELLNQLDRLEMSK